MANNLSQYRYFRGEASCPFPDDYDFCMYWEAEKDHFDAGIGTPYLEYFEEWVINKAAPNSGWNIATQGNPWVAKYLADGWEMRENSK